METEIWPNFTREANRRRIPLILANGRISDHSYSGYLKFAWFFRHSLKLFSALCMQTENDCERIIAIGAPQKRTMTAGNLKYDIPFHPVSNKERAVLRERYAIPKELVVMTAASTHPGEEEYILAAYIELIRETKDLFLVLVPRHPERTNEVAALLERMNLSYRKRSTLKMSENVQLKGGEVLLGNTIGEMMDFYALSNFAFVGGSLVPTGGHNLLEPASLGIPTIYGPYMNNFKEIAELVQHYGAGIRVESADKLPEIFCTLIGNETLRQVLGQNGLKIIRDNGGASERHLQEIARYL